MFFSRARADSERESPTTISSSVSSRSSAPSESTPPTSLDDSTSTVLLNKMKPAIMEGKYTKDRGLEDLPGVKHALDLFLSSHMIEAEEFCRESDPKMCVFASPFLFVKFSSV